MDCTERLKRFELAIEELKDINEDVPVLVEGKRDRKALRTLGLRGRIILVHSGKSLVVVSEDIKKRYEEIVLLTDWDRKGRFLAKKLKDYLRKLEVQVNEDIRKRLFTLSSRETKEVESLDSFYRRLKKKCVAQRI